MAKKNVILILIIYSIVSISCKSNLVNDRNNYIIVSIDSIANVYVIRAKNQSNYYKIVSSRVDKPSLNCKKIKIGKSYKFNLVSLLKNQEFKTMIGGVDFNGESILFERDSITDIHKANNIIGLYFIKKW